MAGGLYSHTTRATGTVLTAAIYNTDHQNHIDNDIPTMMDDYSSNVAQMQATTNPGGVGSEALPTTLSGEIERLRYAIKKIHGGPQRYSPVGGSADVWTDYTRPPLNTNPNWLLDQINEGALYTVSGGTTQGPDGWSGSATGVGTFKLRTITDPDNAALTCLEITCTGADASIGATDKYNIITAIEGYDTKDLMLGTASASKITIMFKFKSNVTGVYGVAILNSASSRRYIGTITVPDTNENSYSITLTLDTTGTWLYTNGVGLYVSLVLAAGSNFQATAGSWGAGAEQTTSSQVNFMSSNTNIAYLKRFHIIPGGVALAYHSQDYWRELTKAQRQYEKSFDAGVAVAQNAGYPGCLQYEVAVASTNQFQVSVPFSTIKRAGPTMTGYNPVAANALWRNISAGTDSATPSFAVNGVVAGTHGFAVANPQVAGDALTNQMGLHWTANARLS